MVDISQNITTLAVKPALGQVRKGSPVPGSSVRPKNFIEDNIKTKTIVEKDGDFGLSANDEPLERVARAVEEFLPESFNNNTKLSINRDETTGLFVYRSIDRESGEVIRQFPPEDVLKYIVSVRKAEGLVVDDKV